MSNLETRSSALESEVKGNTLYGYAMIFGTYALIGGRYVETFHRNAFDATLGNPAHDVRAQYHHDKRRVLGRQKSGTLKLGVDSTGLAFELDLPDTSDGNEVRVLAERGDLTDMSIGFRPNPTPEGETWGVLNGRRLCTRTSIAQLEDISVVVDGAYSEPTAHLRSLDSIPTIDSRTRLLRIRAAHLLKGNV